MDDRLRQMLRELSRALYEAISDSPEAGESIRRIRREGYTLHVLLDCKREEPRIEAEAVAVPPVDGSGDPAFRINGSDLLFLRSIGIDPTRRRRSRARREVGTAERDAVSD